MLAALTARNGCFGLRARTRNNVRALCIAKTPFPVETTCLDIFLRPLLQGVDRLIHVEQVSHDADNKELRQVAKAEDFAANKDRREQRIGGAAKDGCAAQRGAKRDGHAELSLVMATSG